MSSRSTQSLVAALEPSGYSFELIFVDDGSRDNTATLAAELARCDERLYFLRLRRNYGQTPAMSAGIDFAHGEILVTIDGDLQNDPRDIPTLVAAVEEGADLAVGWRRNRKDHTISRLLPSRIANWLIAKVTGISIKDNGCSLKAYRASLIKQIPLYSEMHRFIPAMASIAGARVQQLPVRHHERQFGDSKYGIGRTWRVLFDLSGGQNNRPVQVEADAVWFSAMAFFPGALTVAYGTAAIFNTLGSGGGDIITTGIALQCLALTTFLVACGVIGELQFRAGDTREHRLAGLTAKELPRESG